MTLKDHRNKSKLITYLFPFILILTLLFSGCSQASQEDFIGNNSLKNFLNKSDNTSLPTRDEVVNKLSKIKDNPENFSIGSLLEFDGLKDFKFSNLTKGMHPLTNQTNQSK